MANSRTAWFIIGESESLSNSMFCRVQQRIQLSSVAVRDKGLLTQFLFFLTFSVVYWNSLDVDLNQAFVL